MTKDYYESLKNSDFKDITYRLYNKINDEYIPKQLGKKNNTVYDVEDFEYTTLELDKKEKFLLSMHNKKLVTDIKIMKNKAEEKDCTVYVDFDNSEVTIIKLKGQEL